MESVLEKINTPSDLKDKSLEELIHLSDEIRQVIIDTVSKTGGHIAPSLGVVELTIALHYVFDTPDDKLVWDVGHQTYAHKILTGRKASMETLRQFGGLSGFPKPSESPYDSFGVGHSSTSISAGLGMAQALCLKGEHRKVISIIGDGSLTAGLAFEGLNFAGHVNKDLIIILNDNEMSISPNVGALSSYLSQLISGQTYNRFREKILGVLQNIPGIGEPVFRIAKQSEHFFKGLFVPGLIFEELGFRYIGPILGHRMDLLVENLKNVRNLRGPTLVHVVTKKGKGYAPAEDDPTYFHGVGSFDKTTGKPLPQKKSIPSYTEVFGNSLVKIGAENNRVVAITAGMTSGTGLGGFEKKFPERFFDVGIAEQHAVTFAAGLASEGFIPVAAIYSTFLQRSYDQILHDVCLQNLPVVFMIDRAGIVGEDGPTHHGLFDLSYLRHMPNLVLMAPKDENELQHMFFTALQLSQPVAIRYPRGKGTGVSMDDSFKELPVGEAEVLKDGDDAAIFAIGSTVVPALEAAGRLEEEGIHAAVINSRFVKPIDEKTLLGYAEKVRAVITVEENVLQGGFGSAVVETLQSKNIEKGVVRMGIPDVFVEHGSQQILRAKYGIDAEGIFNNVKKIIRDGQTDSGKEEKKTAG
jgi:1-deoxy-D-xylulose-5-phosphate synthase